MNQFLYRTLTLTFLSLFCSAAFALSAEQGPLQQYRIRIPRSPLSCQHEADLMAARFENATNIKPVASICKDETVFETDGKKFIQYALQLSYRSIKPIEWYSAQLSRSVFGRVTGGRGIYSSYELCLADMDTQTMRFAENAGLSPISVSCQYGSLSDDKEFVLRIDGIGKPIKTLKGDQFLFSGRTTSVEDTKVEQLLEHLGGTIVYRHALDTLYYSKADIALKHDLVAAFQNQEQCLEQQNELRTIYTKLGSKQFSVFCTPTKRGTGTLLEAFRDGSYFLRTENGNTWGRYYSFRECMKDRSTLELKPPVVGAICRSANPTGNEFALDLISKY